MNCPSCDSTDIHSEYLWPRENMKDIYCECNECGCFFDVIDNTTVIEVDGR